MSMAGTEPRGDAKLRGFARQIAKLQRDLRILEVAAQGAYRSVEEGSVDFYDEDGVLRERVGKQKDGSYGRVTLDGPVPPTPSEPDVVVIDNGVVAITWDGRTDEKWPTSEFRMVRVHIDDTATFTPTRNNQVGAIHAQRGGTIVAVTESDDDNPVYVRLVAVSKAGHTSDPSDAVLVDELDEDDLADEQEEIEWEDGDRVTLTAADITAGTVTLPLSYVPEAESLAAWWGPLGVDPDAYTIDYDTPSITFTLGPRPQEGDEVRVQYAHLEGSDAVKVLMPYQSAGWSYLQVARTNASDYSAPTFDDSSWAVGAAPFGDLSEWVAIGDWPDPVTDWTIITRIWARKTFDAYPGRDLTITVRVERYATIWINGTQVADLDHNVEGTSDAGEITFTVDGALVTETNTLAVRATDDTVASGQDYFDMEISQ